MQSSNHIGKIVKQHAEAVENGKASARARRTRKARPSAFNTLPKHRMFVPMITIWGGLLLALITAVLPDNAIAQVSSLTGVYLPLIATRLILACAMGCGGAILGFIIASALSNHAKMKECEGALVSAFKSRDVQPINPASDLGSESFDAPLDASGNATSQAVEAEFASEEEAETHGQPSLGELSRRGYEMEAPEDFEEKNGKSAFTRKHFKNALIESCEGATCEAATKVDTTLQLEQTAVVNPVEGKPRSLDLGEFGSLPGRNAVWVEEPKTAQPDISQITNTPQKPETALQKLRRTPPEDLSLVEMVERFAAALHDHQEQERSRAIDGHTDRETALAEALKALSLFTEAGFDKSGSEHLSESQIGKTEDELRGALERLKNLRGAA
ncbi:MAG: hypothetical protein AAFY42_05630 [Pseudomonadota bacterium]